MAKRLAGYLLLTTQWMLVLVGVLIIFMAVKIHLALADALQNRAATDLVDGYRISQNLLLEIAVGLVSIGLGAGLFYLRRLYLGRR